MTCEVVAGLHSGKISATFSLLRHLVGWMVSAFGSRQDLILENLALRQQLLSMHAKRPAIDYRPGKSSSGWFCDGYGPTGRLP
jgi:hypothetical protein